MLQYELSTLAHALIFIMSQTAFITTKRQISFVRVAASLLEYAVRCGEIKGTAVSFFNISYIHLNERDANSYTIVLEGKENVSMNQHNLFYKLIMPVDTQVAPHL